MHKVWKAAGCPLEEKKILFLGLSSGLFMEGAPALWNGAVVVGRASCLPGKVKCHVLMVFGGDCG